MKKMVYAPIYITTLCRSEHFIREVESLKRNTWAKYTDVYIALDYPAKDSHFNGYNKILEYLNTSNFDEFASFNVIKRESNYGSSRNDREITSYLMSKYDRFICAEDDLEFSPNFLEYMDKCLLEFEDYDSVLAVNGYSYPINWTVSKGATVIKQNGSCPVWGLGCWTKKYQSIESDLKEGYLRNSFKTSIKTGKIHELIPSRKYEYIANALSGNANGLFEGCSDMSMGIYMGLKDMCVITPVISKVKNYGFDGTGVYCTNITDKSNRDSKSYDYENQPIDTSEHFDLILSTDNCNENKEKLANFLFVSPRLTKKANQLFCLYKVFGQTLTEKIYQIIKKSFK